MRLRLIPSSRIGYIRRRLMLPFTCKWNAWVRDITAMLEYNDDSV